MPGNPSVMALQCIFIKFHSGVLMDVIVQPDIQAVAKGLGGG